MTAKGTLTKPLTEGDYVLGVKLGSSTIYEHDGSICGDSSAEVCMCRTTTGQHQ